MNPYQKIASQECWVDVYTLVLGRLGQVDHALRGHIGLHSVFLASLGYTAEVV